MVKDSMIKRAEQRRAKRAFRQVSGVMENSDSKTKKEYRSYVRKLPSFIQTNGLLQTMVFYFSKGKDKKDKDRSAYQQVLAQLTDHLREEGFIQIKAKERNKQLIEYLLNVESSSEYRRITIEIIAFSGYLSRFAEGLYDEKS